MEMVKGKSPAEFATIWLPWLVSMHALYLIWGSPCQHQGLEMDAIVYNAMISACEKGCGGLTIPVIALYQL